MNDLQITKHADGLGIGEGPISAQSVNSTVDSQIVEAVDVLIASDKILVDIDKEDDGTPVDDDGCGDGRYTQTVWRNGALLKRSLRRAKVFGGGATMAMSDKVGAGEAKSLSLEDVFSASIADLRDKHINFGAHTANDALEGSGGCGAIDQSPKVIAFAVKYRPQITKQIKGLHVASEGLDNIFDNFERYAREIDGQAFSGRIVADEIASEGKVVKELGGPHIETRIVLNFVSDKTVNQQQVREVSQGKIDVFAVDVWRMHELAQRLHAGDSNAQSRAFLSMLIYTFATAAVLTKGDLPVYLAQCVSVTSVEH